ncbi:hypothetical protein RN001_000877 [Aquatica leii]|uniref:Uncharacterized protein n=1 Tax=Aquatica leii TaxID=1421715 RepID=A0AAN7PKM4_9COLE|nr:hypothetical protein RN001_000877 [Aquatica leii]
MNVCSKKRRLAAAILLLGEDEEEDMAQIIKLRHETNTYKEAPEKCNLLLYETDSTDCNNADLQKRKKKLNQNSDFEYFEDDNLDDLPDSPFTSNEGEVDKTLIPSVEEIRGTSVSSVPKVIADANGTFNVSDIVLEPFCKCSEIKTLLNFEVGNLKVEIENLKKAVTENSSLIEKFIIQSKREWEAIKFAIENNDNTERRNSFVNNELEQLFQELIPLSSVDDIKVPMNVLPVLPSPSSNYSPSHTSSSSKCTTENIEIEFTDQDWVDVYNTPVCSNFIPETSQDPKRKTSDTSTEPIPTKKFINMCDIFEGGIESILQDTIDGKIVLLQIFRLNNDCRQRLVKEIINFLIGKVGIDGAKTYMLDYCAEEIPKIFPNEAETYQQRKTILRASSLTVQEIFDRYAALSTSLGPDLIELDFNTRFVTYEDKIYSRLSILTNAVIAEANLRKITVIADEDVDLTSKPILTLTYLLAPVTLKNTRKSGNWRPSRSEISESFFLHIENFEELQQKKSDRLDKLKSCSLTLQPFGVICGPLNNAKYLAVVNDVIYTFQSLIRTIEILYKTFHALDIQYPHQCQHIWQLIEEIVFEIKHSPSSSSVTALISDLKKFL